MPDTPQLLPAQDYRRERWRNGQGWTREILREPDSDDFAWRASIAEIQQDTLFSAYPGYRRAQFLLQGQALRLGFTDGRRITLEAPHAATEFDGSEVLACHLPHGPVQVFNLIWNPQTIDALVMHRPLVGPMVFLPKPGVRWLIHLLAGHACSRGERTIQMNPGDSLLLEPERSQRAVLEGGGEVLVLRLATPQPTADTASIDPAPDASSLPNLPTTPDTPDSLDTSDSAPDHALNCGSDDD